MSKVLVIGAGGVSSVAIHKMAQLSNDFKEITLASRTIDNCKKIGEYGYELIKNMDNKTISIITILLGLIILFSKHEYAWIISAVFLGIGSGIFFWKQK